MIKLNRRSSFRLCKWIYLIIHTDFTCTLTFPFCSISNLCGMTWILCCCLLNFFQSFCIFYFQIISDAIPAIICTTTFRRYVFDWECCSCFSRCYRKRSTVAGTICSVISIPIFITCSKLCIIIRITICSYNFKQVRIKDIMDFQCICIHTSEINLEFICRHTTNRGITLKLFTDFMFLKHILITCVFACAIPCCRYCIIVIFSIWPGWIRYCRIGHCQYPFFTCCCWE